jgi:hypothetical protein
MNEDERRGDRIATGDDVGLAVAGVDEERLEPDRPVVNPDSS